MNKYYSNNSDSYFEESRTAVKSETVATAKQVVDTFKDEIVDLRYLVKRPTARKLGHVEK